MKTIKLTLLTLLAGALFTSSFGNPPSSSSAEVEILGAGATFPYPLYSKMFDQYHQLNGAKINYQSIGSGGGIKQLQEKTVDFGASDAPMNDEQISKSPAPIVHVPTCLGAVIVTYNLPGVTQPLKFSSDVIADIFLGKITKWNDARIKNINAGVTLPNMDIAVAHRSDGSGTTYVFTDYLSKVSKEWNDKVGKKTSVDWPVGLGGKGNEGVAGIVKQTPGSIGYVELIYALQNKLPVSLVKNKAGKFIEPNLQSTTAAANVTLPADMRVSITDTDAPTGYPISSFTYILLYANQAYGDRAEAKATEVVKLVNWMVHDGQKFTQPLNYAPLPKDAVKRAEEILKSIKFNSKTLLK
jgi:phosphate transport system substrate-binding protein